MSDYDSPPPKPKENDPDWTKQINCCSIEDRLCIGTLPVHSTLYKAFKTQSPTYKGDIAWYGNYRLTSDIDKGYGGYIYKYKTIETLDLVDMGDVQTIKEINNLFKINNLYNEINALKESFKIVEPFNKPPYIFRQSKFTCDVLIADAMKKIFNNKKPLINGWFHFDLKSHNTSGIMEAEVLLFETQDAGQPLTVNTSKGRSSLIAQNASADRIKNAKRRKHPPRNIIYQSDSDSDW